jgi:hypothetical protein
LKVSGLINRGKESVPHQISLRVLRLSDIFGSGKATAREYTNTPACIAFVSSGIPISKTAIEFSGLSATVNNLSCRINSLANGGIAPSNQIGYAPAVGTSVATTVGVFSERKKTLVVSTGREFPGWVGETPTVEGTQPEKKRKMHPIENHKDIRDTP